MIYTLKGSLIAKKPNFIVVETGNIGFKVLVSAGTIGTLPPLGDTVKLFCFLYVREDGMELYGFLNEQELRFFELLNTISGIGPKSALNVLGIAKVDELLAAIKGGRSDLLSQASGIGKKTAERIILELRNKVEFSESEAALHKMETDEDVIGALMAIGYSREKARSVLSKLDPSLNTSEERFRAALKAFRETK